MFACDVDVCRDGAHIKLLVILLLLLLFSQRGLLDICDRQLHKLSVVHPILSSLRKTLSPLTFSLYKFLKKRRNNHNISLLALCLCFYFAFQYGIHTYSKEDFSGESGRKENKQKSDNH